MHVFGVSTVFSHLFRKVLKSVKQIGLRSGQISGFILIANIISRRQKNSRQRVNQHERSFLFVGQRQTRCNRTRGLYHQSANSLDPDQA